VVLHIKLATISAVPLLGRKAAGSGLADGLSFQVDFVNRTNAGLVLKRETIEAQ
jgi:hypothetical protein